MPYELRVNQLDLLECFKRFALRKSLEVRRL